MVTDPAAPEVASDSLPTTRLTPASPIGGREHAAQVGMRFGLGRGLDHVGLDSVGRGAEPRATFALATLLFSLGSLPLTVIADRYLGRQRFVLAGAGLAVLMLLVAVGLSVVSKLAPATARSRWGSRRSPVCWRRSSLACTR